MMRFDGFLPRMDTGNMEYRVMLRCRDKSREQFIEMRRHVMIKIEMLDEKHGEKHFSAHFATRNTRVF